MANLLQDLRHGFRLLFKNPGFTIIALLTLGIGIGANTAIFSIVNSVLFRPLPYAEPGQLVVVWESMPAIGFDRVGFSPPDLMMFTETQESFTDLGATTSSQYELSGGEVPRRVVAGRVTSGFLRTLGTNPIHGRIFAEEEDEPGHNVMVLSHRLWQEYFSSDPVVIDSTIQLDRQSYTVIGVMPEGFGFSIQHEVFGSLSSDLWIPRAFTPREKQAWGSMFSHPVVARLKPGVSLAAAQAESDLIAARIMDQYPPQLKQLFPNATLKTLINPVRDELVGNLRTPLLVLLGAVSLVLLIGCANVANLLLARAHSRRKEIAVRCALGASRMRVAFQLLVEGIVMALAGGALGLGLAYGGIPLLMQLAPGNLPQDTVVSIDGGVLAFTILLSLATAIFFALAPSLTASRLDSNVVLQEGGRGNSASSRRLQSAFIVAQMALALVLLVGAGLLMRSFQHLMETDPGFQPRRTLALTVPLPLAGYSDANQIRNLYLDLLERFRAMPSAESVGASTDLPLKITETRAFQKVGQDPQQSSDAPAVSHAWVLGDYFQSLQVPLIRGRLFGLEDRLGTTPSVLINEAMAKQYWPDGEPIGEQIIIGDPRPRTIVGIVGDVKDTGLDQPVRAHSYEPYLQVPDQQVATPLWDAFRSLNLVIRTRAEPETLAAAVRQELQRVDPQLAIEDIRSLSSDIESSVAPQRFNMSLLSVFGATALLLSAVGIYGVISYSVTQRTREVGVRIALGASRSKMISMVMRQGMTLVAIGLVLGCVAALALSRVMSSMLYGVGGQDPVTFVAVIALLSGIAIVACIVPAARASRVDPMEALRYE